MEYDLDSTLDSIEDEDNSKDKVKYNEDHDISVIFAPRDEDDIKKKCENIPKLFPAYKNMILKVMNDAFNITEHKE